MFTVGTEDKQYTGTHTVNWRLRVNGIDIFLTSRERISKYSLFTVIY